jgi:D-alanyl-D-alanine carboxypeptidase (penicillin-binding protein 5/6)
MFAADWLVDGAPVRVYGAVLGQDTLADAFASTNALINSAGPNLERQPVVTKDTALASVDTRWGGSAPVLAAADASVIVWPGLKVDNVVEMKLAAESVKKGQEVGTVTYTAGAQVIPVPLLAGESLSGAGIQWRLTRLR